MPDRFDKYQSRLHARSLAAQGGTLRDRRHFLHLRVESGLSTANPLKLQHKFPWYIYCSGDSSRSAPVHANQPTSRGIK